MSVIVNPFTGQLELVPASGGGGGGSPAARFTQTFNNTTDWGSPSGGYYTITILQSAHTKGTHPNVTIYELNGASYEQVNVDLISINASGDVAFRVLSSPDLRFTGLVLII